MICPNPKNNVTNPSAADLTLDLLIQKQMPSLLYVAIMAKPINIAESDITAFDPHLLLKTTGSS